MLRVIQIIIMQKKGKYATSSLLYKLQDPWEDSTKQVSSIKIRVLAQHSHVSSKFFMG